MTMASMDAADAPVDVETSRHALRQYTTTAKVFHWLTVGLIVFMVSSAVMAKQLHDGPWADLLFMMHKTTGLITLAVVLTRLCYRLVQWCARPQETAGRRAALHWIIYAAVTVVPLLGWAGISAFGSREIIPGVTVPAIWPQDGAQADVIFLAHAYAAFALLALVVVHIGLAMQDYMMRADEPGRSG